MTTVDRGSSHRQRKTVYVVVGIVLGVLLLTGYLLFRSARSNADAEAKADLLISRLVQEGARTPSQEQLVRLFGTDGGSICADPDAAFARATSEGGISGGGPGTRPVLPEAALVRGQLLVVEVYCPEKLAGFKDFLNRQGFANVTGG
ncbi:hypothetical protein GCM10027598_61350 [Amycolatopsis oliviviridis]|uniref:Uncharacterized protein n=1 Tax=Amycolatopsis oliviviridis TaxID=1471590 RepID=A0ABQ3M3T3_9PSEU|nr:hypothetical protein [Amycolatopsis oliviviridis]GHH32473.1 hypothetical protein GCM10017790_69640 [Amycolatopsis oliviviridis]